MQSRVQRIQRADASMGSRPAWKHYVEDEMEIDEDISRRRCMPNSLDWRAFATLAECLG